MFPRLLHIDRSLFEVTSAASYFLRLLHCILEGSNALRLIAFGAGKGWAYCVNIRKARRVPRKLSHWRQWDNDQNLNSVAGWRWKDKQDAWKDSTNDIKWLFWQKQGQKQVQVPGSHLHQYIATGILLQIGFFDIDRSKGTTCAACKGDHCWVIIYTMLLLTESLSWQLRCIPAERSKTKSRFFGWPRYDGFIVRLTDRLRAVYFRPASLLFEWFWEVVQLFCAKYIKLNSSGVCRAIRNSSKHWNLFANFVSGCKDAGNQCPNWEVYNFFHSLQKEKFDVQTRTSCLGETRNFFQRGPHKARM